MKRISAILILAALSGCYSIRDFPEWTDRQDRTHTMLINANNNLHRRVEDLENDVRYLRRHATPFKTDGKAFKNFRRNSDGERAAFRAEGVEGRFRASDERHLK